jgi:hypothetical protein
MKQDFIPPWWVRFVAPLKTNCWACNIWRGIIIGFLLGSLAVASLNVAVLLYLKGT